MRKIGFWVLLAVACVVGWLLLARGTTSKTPKASPPVVLPVAPAEVVQPAVAASPTAEEVKLRVRHQEILRDLAKADPSRQENWAKLSDAERESRTREIRSIADRRQAEALLQLQKEFPEMKPTDIPMALRRVQDFIAVLNQRYYRIQEEEVGRLQAANAYTEASDPLVRLQAVQRLAEEYPDVGDQGIRALLDFQENGPAPLPARVADLPRKKSEK